VPYELFSDEPLTLKAETCAQIVEYPPNNKTAAFVQQWVEGNKVYDDALPNSTCKLPKPGGGLILKGCENMAEVYKGMVGKYEVTLNLEFNPDKEWLDLRYNRCELDSPALGSKLCQPASSRNLFTWSTYLAKWFSMNMDVNDIEVKYNAKDANYIETLEEDLGNELRQHVTNWLKSTRDIQVNSNQIQINFTDPYP
jgi:hypothetical protein